VSAPPRIQYRDGYKYQLVADYVHDLGHPGAAIRTPYLVVAPDGILTVRAGYAWDGPSGPTIDTKNFMRGSLVHDALYQLIRDGLLPEVPWREWADALLWQICREDGMCGLRAWVVWRAVRRFGAPSADPAHERPVQVAP
jgi:hypothetical protein